MNLLVVAFTGYWVYVYTRETQALRRDNHRLAELAQVSTELAHQTRIDEMRPVVVFSAKGSTFNLSNIGKGPALEIELRLSQVHPTGALTNLRNLIEDNKFRDLFNLGVGSSRAVESDAISKYMHADEPAFQWGQKNVFVAIATYTDVDHRAYFTLVAVNVENHNGVSVGVFKRVKTGLFDGNIDKLTPLDWMA